MPRSHVEDALTTDSLAVTQEDALPSTHPVLATLEGLSFPLSLLKH